MRSAAADRALAHARSRPATLGAGRLIGIDGPAGSGKTTLAADVAALADAPVVHLDNLYPGWDGLFEVDAMVLGLLRPLSQGRPGRYRRWDWYAGEYRETVLVEPVPLLVLEGVGAGNAAWSDLVTTLVWVEAPPDVRRARALDRDGEGLLEHWAGWTADEERLFREQGTRARVDVVVES